MISWPFLLGLFTGLGAIYALVLYSRGYTMRGRYETSTHVCRPPRFTRRLPSGARWRCRRCGMSWTLDTHGSSWRCKACRLQWTHDRPLVRDPGPWGSGGARIAELERELGLDSDN